MTDSFTITLPFPPSSNRIWRAGVSKAGKPYQYRSHNYRGWINEAYTSVIMQRKSVGSGIRGNFKYHLTLDERKRKVARDGENRLKGVLDFLQNVGLIDDDKLADAGSWSWGPVEGCVVHVMASE